MNIMRWNKENWVDFAEQVGYFALAILFFNSIGVWLPAVIDYYNCSAITTETYKATPSNMMTYFLGLITVAVIDRIRKLIKLQNHPSKFLEFMGWITVSIVTSCIIFYMMKHIKDNQIAEAVTGGLVGIGLTYLVWWISYYQPIKPNSYGSLGRESVN